LLASKSIFPNHLISIRGLSGIASLESSKEATPAMNFTPVWSCQADQNPAQAIPAMKFYPLSKLTKITTMQQRISTLSFCTVGYKTETCETSKDLKGLQLLLSRSI
jgi:hypothetical protein